MFEGQFRTIYRAVEHNTDGSMIVTYAVSYPMTIYQAVTHLATLPTGATIVDARTQTIAIRGATPTPTDEAIFDCLGLLDAGITATL